MNNDEAILTRIRSGYHALERRIHVTLNTQLGDAARLNAEAQSVERFRLAALQHALLIPQDELELLKLSLESMIEALEVAAQHSGEPPDHPPPEFTTSMPSGGPGRPRLEIDEEFLANALRLRGSTGIAQSQGCSARTVRRRALEAGLVEPGNPIFVEAVGDDGSIVRLHCRKQPNSTTLTDEALDAIMFEILERFPLFGRRLICGHLKYLGHLVSRERVRRSYVRVQGVPAEFSRRCVKRRVYQVAGPNALWHHDGQHGLIRYRIVFHAFIDGFSRLLTAIKASNNNRADTVLALFLDAISVHGTPSRVRGDRGVENLGVAEWMENHQGVGRGSYIWGRSVHNIRIERLWVDLTTGLGHKWHQFFLDLEVHHGLLRDNDAHIWLLHYLFLDAINTELRDWAGTWNAHTLTIRGERDQSPDAMWFFGMVQHGLRGVTSHTAAPEVYATDEAEPDVFDLQDHGIDWRDIQDDDIFRHHNQHNFEPQEADAGVEWMEDHGDNSGVVVPASEAPLTEDEMGQLQLLLETVGVWNVISMGHRVLAWQHALGFCQTLALTRLAEQ